MDTLVGIWNVWEFPDRAFIVFLVQRFRIKDCSLPAVSSMGKDDAQLSIQTISR